MAFFDVSKEWRILAPASIPAAWSAAEELALYICLLRGQAGLLTERPPVEDAGTVSPPAYAPIILLNAAAETRDRNGFAWRVGGSRIEINGDSGRGLWNGVFDFLAALGLSWPRPGQEKLPAPSSDKKAPAAAFLLKNDRACVSSMSAVKDRRRLIAGEKTGKKEQEALVRWAARNKYDALVFPLSAGFFWNSIRRGRGIWPAIERYALILEAGGRDLSLLLPRRLFFINRNLFRMESGIRSRKHHFCPTNPQTITRIKAGAEELFLRALPGMAAQSAPPVFHLWPERGHEKTWCACPACRAFSPVEQYRIAANSAADVLAKLAPAARLSCFEESEETESGGDAADAPGCGIVPRENIFVLNACPAGGEE